MARITVVTKILFLAAIAPALMLVAAPYLAGGFYVFGEHPGMIHERELAAMQAARGMEAALYKMQWARTQRDSAEILMDQQRAFAHWLDLARDRSETGEQRQILTAIAAQAGPLFEQLRNSSPQDESVDRRARDLQSRINDLAGADDRVLLELASASRLEARRLIAVTLVAGLIGPWLCLAIIVIVCGRLRNELRAIRQSLDGLRARAAALVAADKDLAAINDALTRLGFPQPNPMLAE
jgi:hypothetical protein